MLLQLLHVCANKHLAQLDKVAVLLVVDLNDTPGVATAADLATFGSGDLGVGTDNGKGDLVHNFVVLGNGLLVVELVARALEDLNVVVLDVAEDLEMVLVVAQELISFSILTRCLKAAISSSVRVSDLAMTGIRLTLVCRRRITSTSRGLSE